jgi:hypothetical protein
MSHTEGKGLMEDVSLKGPAYLANYQWQKFVAALCSVL